MSNIIDFEVFKAGVNERLHDRNKKAHGHLALVLAGVDSGGLGYDQLAWQESDDTEYLDLATSLEHLCMSTKQSFVGGKSTFVNNRYYSLGRTQDLSDAPPNTLLVGNGSARNTTVWV